MMSEDWRNIDFACETGHTFFLFFSPLKHAANTSDDLHELSVPVNVNMTLAAFTEA